LTLRAVPAPRKKHGHKGGGGTFRNGIKDRGIKQLLPLENEKTLNERTLYEALRRKFQPEAVKIAVAFSAGSGK
jgi:hypothetical protein